MVEQEAVNFEVAGSSPASGAKHKHLPKGRCFCFDGIIQAMKKLNKYKKSSLLLAVILLVGIAVGGYFYTKKTNETLNSVFYIDGTAYECSEAIPGKVTSEGISPKNIEDLRNFCRPYSSSNDPLGCGPGGEYCIEYRAVIDILKRGDVRATVSKYGSVRSSVRALGHKYIDDKEYLTRILPGYSGTTIDCIIVVHSPESTRFFIENGDVHESHDDHKYIEVPSDEFLTSLNNASDEDVTAFWLGLH